MMEDPNWVAGWRTLMSEMRLCPSSIADAIASLPAVGGGKVEGPVNVSIAVGKSNPAAEWN